MTDSIYLMFRCISQVYRRWPICLNIIFFQYYWKLFQKTLMRGHVGFRVASVEVSFQLSKLNQLKRHFLLKCISFETIFWIRSSKWNFLPTISPVTRISVPLETLERDCFKLLLFCFVQWFELFSIGGASNWDLFLNLSKHKL